MVETKQVTMYSYVVLGLLLLVYILNQWDRYLFNYLSTVPITDCGSSKDEVCYYDTSIKDIIPLTSCSTCPDVGTKGYWPKCMDCQKCLNDHDASKYNLKYGACISNVQYGLISGVGFTIVYAVVGLIAGRTADVVSRKWIVAVALLTWSGAIVWQGASNNFESMIGSRLLLGIGEAFLAPAAYSIIAAYFPAEKRATANGFYSLGVYVGGALSSVSLAVAAIVGWRLLSYCIGLAGIVVAVIFLLGVREPEKDEKKASSDSASASPTFFESLASMLSNTIIIMLFIASSLRFMGGYAIGSYLPVYFSRRYPDLKNQYSLINAFVISIGGAISSFGGGRLTDYLVSKAGKEKGAHIRALIPALGCILGLPFFAGTVLADNFYVAMTCLFFEYLFAECWLGPAMAVLQSAVPENIRAFTVACYLFFGTMFGVLAPFILGLLDDNTTFIKYYLLILVAISYGTAAIIFLVLTGILKSRSAKEEGLLDQLIINKEDKAKA